MNGIRLALAGSLLLNMGLIVLALRQTEFWNRRALTFGRFELTGWGDSMPTRMIREAPGGKVVIPPTVMILNIENGKVTGTRKRLSAGDDVQGSRMDGQKALFPDGLFFDFEVETGKVRWFEDIYLSKEVRVDVRFE